MSNAAIAVLALSLSVPALPAMAQDLETGIRLYKDREFEQAEKSLRMTAEKEPGDVEANFYLALTLVELKKYEEAEPFFTQAMESKHEARVGLAHSYVMREKFDEAKRELDVAAKELPKNAEIPRLRGMILLKANNYDQAAKELTRAVDLDPKDAYAHYYLGMAQSRLRRPDLMVKHFQFFLKLAPDAPEADKVRALLRAL